MTDSPSPLEEWRSALVSVMGTDVGTDDSRRAFASAVLSGLTTSLPLGYQAADQRRVAAELAEAAATARDRLEVLRELLYRERTSLYVRESGSLAGVRAAVEHVSALASRLDEHKRRTDAKTARRGGRDTALALSIAQTIAAQYRQHFHREPGMSGRSEILDTNRLKPTGVSTRNYASMTPYGRVCDVVEALLDDLYRQNNRNKRSETRISDAVRRKAVRLGREPKP